MIWGIRGIGRVGRGGRMEKRVWMRRMVMGWDRRRCSRKIVVWGLLLCLVFSLLDLRLDWVINIL
jgi:hypothetical protein